MVPVKWVNIRRNECVEMDGGLEHSTRRHDGRPQRAGPIRTCETVPGRHKGAAQRLLKSTMPGKRQASELRSRTPGKVVVIKEGHETLGLRGLR